MVSKPAPYCLSIIQNSSEVIFIILFVNLALSEPLISIPSENTTGALGAYQSISHETKLIVKLLLLIFAFGEAII